MPKLKTRKGISKRIRVTRNGKLVRRHAWKSHLLEHKSAKRKRDFRRLWIARINAAARQGGLPYNQFMYGLRQAGVEIDRKVLADLAVRDSGSFARLVEVAKQSL